MVLRDGSSVRWASQRLSFGITDRSEFGIAEPQGSNGWLVEATTRQAQGTPPASANPGKWAPLRTRSGTSCGAPERYTLVKTSWVQIACWRVRIGHHRRAHEAEILHLGCLATPPVPPTSTTPQLWFITVRACDRDGLHDATLACAVPLCDRPSQRVARVASFRSSGPEQSDELRVTGTLPAGSVVGWLRTDVDVPRRLSADGRPEASCRSRDVSERASCAAVHYFVRCARMKAVTSARTSSALVSLKSS